MPQIVNLVRNKSKNYKLFSVEVRFSKNKTVLENVCFLFLVKSVAETLYAFTVFKQKITCSILKLLIQMFFCMILSI